MTDAVELWQEAIGQVPHKVVVYEKLDKERVLYLRWRADGNWRHRSLKRTLRTKTGRIIDEVRRWAIGEAQKQRDLLIAGLPAEAQVAARAPLTLAEGLTRALDAKSGKYPADTMHRREVIRSVQEAIVIWGADRPWADIKRAQLRELWRARIEQLKGEGHTGLRGAEVTMKNVLAVAQWLRDEELISIEACIAPRDWKEKLRTDWRELVGADADPDVARPRHSIEEMRRLLVAGYEVDPRLGLLLALGAELRAGQVRRARRKQLSLDARVFTVRTKGKKKGAVVYLTPGQLRSVQEAITTGYLRDLEAAYQAKELDDYQLFPAGQMPGGRSGKPVATVERHSHGHAIGSRPLLGWFKEAEVKAAIEHVDGRGFYGLRRVAVDEAKKLKISREGLQEHGGWSDSQIPDSIYADTEAGYARDEARDTRAKIRGEGP